MTEWSTSLVESPAGVFVSEQRVAAEDFISEIKSGSWLHCHSHRMRRSQSLKREYDLTKKLNQLKKTVDSFEE